MPLLKTLLVLTLLPAIIIFATLYRNDARLLEQPGFSERLKIFLSSSKAQTSSDHILPELRTPVFQENARALFGRVMHEAIDLGWVVVSDDREKHKARFTVRSPVFLFEDDVTVQVEAVTNSSSALHIASQSRTGSADFAANSSHIQRLVNRMQASAR